MRFLKKQKLAEGRHINEGAPGLNLDDNGLFRFNTQNAMVVPKGAQADRPFFAEEGLLRYNTDEGDFEVYQNSQWKPIRFREPIVIHNQNLGNGDGSETVFGPLDSNDPFYPVPIAETNILVLVENVFQLPVSNYTIVQNPTGVHGPNAPYAAGYYIVFGTPVPTGKPVNVLHNFDK
jgi:hypothetical protein